MLVHRCLAASLGLMKLPEKLKDRDDMEGVVSNMNDRHTNAARAGRSSAQLHTLVFFREKEVVADARVIRVQSNGIIVLVPDFGIEGPVYFQDSADAEENTHDGTSPGAGQQVSFPCPPPQHCVVLFARNRFVICFSVMTSALGLNAVLCCVHRC